MSKFPEDSYLDANPDVKTAVTKGQFKNGKHLWDMYGKDENREGLSATDKEFWRGRQ
jgi:hypothetical protein